MYEGFFLLFFLLYFLFLLELIVDSDNDFFSFFIFFTIKEETDYPLLFSSFRHHCGIIKRKQLLANHLKKHRLIKKKKKTVSISFTTLVLEKQPEREIL